MAQPLDIEKIVQEVLAALRELGVAGPPASKAALSPGGAITEASQRGYRPGGGDAQPAGGARAGVGGGKADVLEGAQKSTSNPSTSRPPAPEDGQLRISSRVVTMAHLRACGVPENLAGIRRVVVRPDALITPLVRDELQRRNIPLVREVGWPGTDGPGPIPSAGQPGVSQAVFGGPSAQGEPAGSRLGGANGSTKTVGLLVMVHGRAYEPTGLLRRLATGSVPVEVRQRDCIFQATDELAERLRAGNCLGVLLSRYAAIGLCAANRHLGVRAVWGLEPGQAASDTASLGANLLVINPRQVSPYQLEKMIHQFYLAGLRPCPEVLKSRLG